MKRNFARMLATAGLMGSVMVPAVAAHAISCDASKHAACDTTTTAAATTTVAPTTTPVTTGSQCNPETQSCATTTTKGSDTGTQGQGTGGSGTGSNTSGQGSGSLPFTGGDVAGMALIGIGLAAGGTVLVRSNRRRAAA